VSSSRDERKEVVALTKIVLKTEMPWLLLVYLVHCIFEEFCRIERLAVVAYLKRQR
jgi:hypothetical protein